MRTEEGSFFRGCLPFICSSFGIAVARTAGYVFVPCSTSCLAISSRAKPENKVNRILRAARSESGAEHRRGKKKEKKKRRRKIGGDRHGGTEVVVVVHDK